MRIAIIDLGTNTFNLLIADQTSDHSYHTILETKYPAKLGQGGINSGIILPEAMERGIQALKMHQRTMNEYKVCKVKCFATSAIRSAANGQEFVQRVKAELNLDIQVIDGKKEAQLIFDGVKQVVPISNKNVLILDIGGGSNEFIIANRDGVLWMHSFDLGIARLLDHFQPSDPILPSEVEAVEAYIKPQLKPLYEAMMEYQPQTLIGSSGSFDTVAGMIAAQHHPHLDVSKLTSYKIPFDYIQELHQRFLQSTMADRTQMERMDLHRVEMIVLASIFINFILREFNITNVWQCAFALKEGAIHQLLTTQTHYSHGKNISY